MAAYSKRRKVDTLAISDEEDDCEEQHDSDSDFEPEAEKESEVDRLRREVEQLRKENTSLKKKKVAAMFEPAKTTAAPPSSAMDEKTLEKMKKNITSQIKGVMVYRRGIKHSKSRINLQVPNLTLQQVKQLLGKNVADSCSEGPKQLQAKLTNDQLYGVLGVYDISKSLRYGASLSPVEGSMKFTYNKSDSVLTISGFYTM